MIVRGSGADTDDASSTGFVRFSEKLRSDGDSIGELASVEGA